MLVLLLFIAAVVLIYIELFVPGGVFGVTGIIAFVASIVIAFTQYGEMGFIIAICEVVVATVLIVIGIKRFPRSLAGRRLILGRNLDKSYGYSGTESLDAHKGGEGETLTALRPAGIAQIGDTRLNVVSDGTFIEKGKKVKVVEVEGNRVVVREIGTAT